MLNLDRTTSESSSGSRARWGGWVVAALFMAGVASGCGRKAPAPTEVEASDTPAPTAEAVETPADLAAVNASLQQGAVDEAAARLYQMRATGRPFSQEEAALYRQALDEAYSKALEGAQRGDPQAEAALKMIRAAEWFVVAPNCRRQPAG
jgi:hypothetical protein